MVKSVLSKGNADFFVEVYKMTILETKNLKKYYGKGDTQVKALDGVNLSVEDGEFVAIVGTSGSGKSTLLHMLGGLDRPTSGSVTVDGKNIFSLKDEALTIFRRRKIGFVFQSFNLVPVLTVRENIVLPIQLDGGKVDERYVGEVVTALGLEKKLNSLPGQLSGGQQQRVAIARALATKPAILLADEPTGNLDSRTSQDVLSLMKVTGRKFSQTMVMITHNEEIAQLSDRIVRIEDGRIAVSYTHLDVYKRQILCFDTLCPGSCINLCFKNLAYPALATDKACTSHKHLFDILTWYCCRLFGIQVIVFTC